MADHSSTARTDNNYYATLTSASSNHQHTKNNKKYYNQHASSTMAAIIANPSTASRSHSLTSISSNIIILPSNVPLMTDSYFGKPSPINIPIPSNTEASHSTTTNISPSTTPIVGSPNKQQQQQQQQIAGPLVGAILGSLGLIGIIVGVLICIKRQKKNKKRQEGHIYSNNSRARAMINNQQQYQQQQKGQHYITTKREESNHSDSSTLQPPSASYTPHCQKRLTTDTLVDQRASMSTMNSTYSSRNHQYKPQLAYKQQLYADCDVNTGQNDPYHLDGVSPSNTLVDTTAITMALTDDEKTVENNNSRRQRVPSYQPQIVAMTDDEIINNSSYNNKQHVPAGQQEQHATNNNDKDNYNGIYANDVRGVITSNYYDYLYQSNYSGEGQEQQQEQKHVNHRQEEK